MHDLTALEDFFDNAGFALHIAGGDGTIIRANEAELQLLGYTAEEYVGRNIREFHVDQAALSDILTRLSRGEKLKGHPAQLRAKDGSIRHVEITSSARFRNGEFVSTRSLTVDVSKARLAEESRRDAGHFWKAALDALPAAVYTTDAEGRITYFNEAAVELSGRRPVLGSDSWCVTWRLFNLDGSPLPHDECPMAVGLKEERPIRGAEAIAERPDGTRVRFTPFPTPLYDRSGRFMGAINLLVDVTEQRVAETDAARLAAIVKSSNDAIVSKTLDGIVTSWNEAATRMFGYEPSEMIGQSITRIIPPELQSEETQILAKLRRGEPIEHYETERVTKDGRRLDVSLSISAVKDKAGRLIGAAKVARDISQRKQAERNQRLLLGELNHRVKNTLATVQSIASQTLRKAKSPSEFVPSFLGRVQALAQAHGVLTEANWHGAELGHLIRNQLFADASSDDRITCSGPEIVLDPQLALHLALVIHELGTNARKHGALSSGRGRVSVSWRVESVPLPALQLHWRETGGPPIYVEADREPGFGTLLIERSMAAIEGGEAHMGYESHGISWSFIVPLPLSAPVLETSERKPSFERLSRDAPTSRDGQRVLIVEDEPLVAMDMEGALREAGYEVAGPVTLVDEALGLIARTDVDAVLLDANLGGKPVDELAAALTRRRIPFTFVTGYGRDSLPTSFASAPLLAKPFSTAALLNSTQRMLSSGKHGLRVS